ncbi:hypothetical protein TWF191_002955 [Orbilia oligospora]|uniref:Uncharacterized protein n=1 Tax=Orbilia oligospora TaxID=2813651 RepID=A0A7C8QAR5_ORBOL|nr:hypothetical protein TWF191_002955 [Orbilia oligospora]
MEFTFAFGAPAPTTAPVAPASATTTTTTITAAASATTAGSSIASVSVAPQAPVAPKQRKIAACRAKKPVSIPAEFAFSFPVTPSPATPPPAAATPMEISTPMETPPTPMDICFPSPRMEPVGCLMPAPIVSALVCPSVTATLLAFIRASNVAQLLAHPPAMQMRAVRVPRAKTEAEILREEAERSKKQWELECAKEAAWEEMARRALPPVARTKFTMKPASFWVNLTPIHEVRVDPGNKAPVVSAARSKAGGVEVDQQWFNRNTAKHKLERMLAIGKLEREAKKRAQAEREAENAAKIAIALDGLSACAERKPTFVGRAIKAVAPLAPLAKYVVPFMTYITMEMLQHSISRLVYWDTNQEADIGGQPVGPAPGTIKGFGAWLTTAS